MSKPGKANEPYDGHTDNKWLTIAYALYTYHVYTQALYSL